MNSAEMSNAFSEKIIEDRAKKITKVITSTLVDLLQSLGRESNMMQSPIDSGLVNLWEEVCVQVQGEQSVFWEAYLDYIKDETELILSKSYNMYDKLALWLQTENGFDWLFDLQNDQSENIEDYFGEKYCPNNYCDDDIVKYLLDKLLSKAADFTNDRIENYL